MWPCRLCCLQSHAVAHTASHSHWCACRAFKCSGGKGRCEQETFLTDAVEALCYLPRTECRLSTLQNSWKTKRHQLIVQSQQEHVHCACCSDRRWHFGFEGHSHGSAIYFMVPRGITETSQYPTASGSILFWELKRLMTSSRMDISTLTGNLQSMQMWRTGFAAWLRDWGTVPPVLVAII